MDVMQLFWDSESHKRLGSLVKVRPNPDTVRSAVANKLNERTERNVNGMAATVNLKAMESMIYFWEATKDREKVGEQYLVSLAAMEEMAPLYDAEFTPESVRKVLSAISNREQFEWNRKEGRFWNNSMWMLEDLGLTRAMLAPVKTLNLDGLDTQGKDVEVVFIPGHLEPSYTAPGKLTLNFFRIQMAMDGSEQVTFEGVPLLQYIQSNV